MNRNWEIWAAGAITALLLAVSASASGNGASGTAHHAGKEIGKGSRVVQDELCRTVHGKLPCLGRKAKPEARNTADDLETK